MKKIEIDSATAEEIADRIVGKTRRGKNKSNERLQAEINEILKGIQDKLDEQIKNFTGDSGKSPEKVVIKVLDDFVTGLPDVIRTITENNNELEKKLYNTSKLSNEEIVATVKELNDALKSAGFDQLAGRLTEDFKKSQKELNEINENTKQLKDLTEAVTKAVEDADERSQEFIDAVNKIPGGKWISGLLKPFLDKRKAKEINDRLKDIPGAGKVKGEGVAGSVANSVSDSISKGFGPFLKFGAMFLAVAGVLATLFAIGKALYDRNASLRTGAKDVGKGAGQAYEDALKQPYEDALENATNDIDKMITISTEDVANTMGKMLDQGMMKIDLTKRSSKALIQDASILEKSYGISTDYARLTSEYMGNTVKAHEVLKDAFITSNKRALNFKKIVEGINTLGKNLRFYFRKGTEEAFKFLQKLQGMGTTIEHITTAMDGLFDYGDALKFANDINRVLGQSVISSDRILRIYEEGPEAVVEMQREILRMTDLTNMSLKQQKLLADSMHMGVEDMLNMKRNMKMEDTVKDFLDPMQKFMNDTKKMNNADRKKLTDSFRITFGVDKDSIDKLKDPENFQGFLQLAGGLERIQDILAMEAGSEEQNKAIKQVLDNVAKNTKGLDQLNDMLPARTLEDIMSGGFDALGKYLSKILYKVTHWWSGSDTINDSEDIRVAQVELETARERADNKNLTDAERADAIGQVEVKTKQLNAKYNEFRTANKGNTAAMGMIDENKIATLTNTSSYKKVLADQQKKLLDDKKHNTPSLSTSPEELNNYLESIKAMNNLTQTLKDKQYTLPQSFSASQSKDSTSTTVVLNLDSNVLATATSKQQKKANVIGTAQ